MSVLSRLILISVEEPSRLAKENIGIQTNIKQRWDVVSITALAINQQYFVHAALIFTNNTIHW